MWGLLGRITSVPHNTIVDLNNVMRIYLTWSKVKIMTKLPSTKDGHQHWFKPTNRRKDLPNTLMGAHFHPLSLNFSCVVWRTRVCELKGMCKFWMLCCVFVVRVMPSLLISCPPSLCVATHRWWHHSPRYLHNGPWSRFLFMLLCDRLLFRGQGRMHLYWDPFMTMHMCSMRKFQTSYLSLGLVLKAHASKVCHLWHLALLDVQRVFWVPVKVEAPKTDQIREFAVNWEE